MAEQQPKPKPETKPETEPRPIPDLPPEPIPDAELREAEEPSETDTEHE